MLCKVKEKKHSNYKHPHPNCHIKDFLSDIPLDYAYHRFNIVDHDLL